MSPISDVDLDRLADYTTGLLDPHDRARVEELIRTDPDWRRAHAALIAAQPRLDAALGTLREAPLPADIAGRLDTVLAEATGTPDPGTATVIPLRRWPRRAVWTGAAAAAVAAVFGGVLALSNGVTNPAAPGGSRLAGPSGSAVVLHSQTNYTPQSVSALTGNTAAAEPLPSGVGPEIAPPDAQQRPRGADAGLDRLADPAALRACLDAIVAGRGGTPTTVDYARFEGRPALIVVLSGTDGRRVVVAGPRCGVAGPDELYTTG